MKAVQTFVVIALSTLIMTSCMGIGSPDSEGSQKSSEITDANNGVPPPEMVQKIKDDAVKREQLD